MGASPVVMGLVPGEDGAQMPFAGDQHPVGDLGPGGEHEPFRIAVRSRAPRRDFHDRDTSPGQHRVERCGELTGAVPDQEPGAGGAIVEVHQQVADLLGGPWPVRVRGDAGDVHVTGADLQTNRQYSRWRVTAQSTWKKSVASIAAAWVCRNLRHVVSVCRSGAGGIFRVLRIRRMAEALTRWPSLSSSPWIRW